MSLRLSLQWRILVLMVGGMTGVLLLSAYLHQLVTETLLEGDRYDKAVAQTVAIGARISALQLFDNPNALVDDILLVSEARRDFVQIDVYRGGPIGLKLVATTIPSATRLPALDEHTADNELHEMEHPVPDVVTMEVERKGVRYWMISMAIKQRADAGFVTALVVKNSNSPLIAQLQYQHNLVLAGAMAVCIVIFGFLFTHFFLRPARDIVHAMAGARGGNFSSRVQVRRDDEIGEIGRGFNALMDDLRGRDRERNTFLATISGFNEQLQEEIRRATADLRALNEELYDSQQRLVRAERLGATGQVAATLAHDIGTPLNSIAGHLRLLARRHPDDLDMQRRVGIIDQQLESIVRSVKGLLSRTHKRHLSLKPTNLNHLIGDLLRLVGPTLDAHSIRVDVSLDGSLPPVLADRDSLHVVLLNLINNAIDAMPMGGTLTLRTATLLADGVAEIVVQDTGSGIAAEALEHLFEPMWTTKSTGSGFGLAIAREIMIGHNGGIDIDRTVDAGARIRLQVPLAVAAAVV
jgi:two-component system, NtrC family, sensor kinase